MEATEAVLEQIEEYDGEYRCYVTVDPEGALRKAALVQKRIEAGGLTAAAEPPEEPPGTCCGFLGFFVTPK